MPDRGPTGPALENGGGPGRRKEIRALCSTGEQGAVDKFREDAYIVEYHAVPYFQRAALVPGDCSCHGHGRGLHHPGVSGRNLRVHAGTRERFACAPCDGFGRGHPCRARPCVDAGRRAVRTAIRCPFALRLGLSGRRTFRARCRSARVPPVDGPSDGRVAGSVTFDIALLRVSLCSWSSSLSSSHKRSTATRLLRVVCGVPASVRRSRSRRLPFVHRPCSSRFA